MTGKLAKFYDLTALDRAQLGERTRAKYRRELEKALIAGINLADPVQLADYAAGLPRSSRAFLKAAIRVITGELANQIKASVTPETLQNAQAALLRLEAMNSTIQVKAAQGEKAHIWLSQAEVRALMATCDDSLTGRRDWVILALLVGAGLRRDELAGIRCEDLTDVPGKNGKVRWLLTVTGKGEKSRVIPINPVLADRLRAWCQDIQQGLVARSLGRKKELGDSLSEIGIFNIVRKHGALIGKPDLDPHDLRRTYAQLGYEAGIPITQISRLLGHSSVKTTQTYLNLDLDIETTISDFIPLV